MLAFLVNIFLYPNIYYRAIYHSRLISFTNAEKKAADVNGDGEVNMIDALRIQKFDAGLADTLR